MSPQRILIVDATEVAERARAQHQLSGAMVKYNAEAMVASVLLSNQIKGEERMSVQIRTEDPFIAFTCDVTAQGEIRAQVAQSIKISFLRSLVCS